MSAAVEQDQCVQEILEVGHCVLRNHFPVEAVMAYREAFLSLLADVAQRIPDGNRGEHRWAIGLPFARPFYHSEFFIDPTVNGIVSRILGEDMHISYYGTDTPCKGSQYQAFHADLPLLFPEQPQFRHPPLLLSLRFTFGDMTLANGPFEVAPGTQHLPRESTLAKAEAGELACERLELAAGDVLISDSRTVHRGTPNLTDEPRPFAVIVFNRRYYFSDGHERRLEANEHTPIMTESFYQSLSQQEQYLLRRVRRTAD